MVFIAHTRLERHPQRQEVSQRDMMVLLSTSAPLPFKKCVLLIM